MIGKTTKHYWSGSDIAMDTNANGVAKAKYYRGITPIAIENADDTYFYHFDEKKSTTHLTTSDGDRIDYEYDAFGNLLTGSNVSNPYNYCGEYQDSETGYIYLRNRYYDPSIGRFIQQDEYWNTSNMIYGDKQYDEGEIKIPDNSAIAQSTNLYVYCMNDPVNFYDTFGTVAGELFYSISTAVQDWAWNNYGYTSVTGREKGAALYTLEIDGVQYYSYTWSNVGGYEYCDPKEFQNYRPDGSTLVGYVHSHYTYPYLSDKDRALARSEGLSVYMVYCEDGIGQVDVYRKTSYGYSEIKNLYTIYGYASWTHWGGVSN